MKVFGFTAVAVLTALMLLLVPPHVFGIDAGKKRSEALSSRPRITTLRFSPLKLAGGTHLTVVSTDRWSHLAEEVREILKETHQQFSGLFGTIPPLKTSVRLMDEELFFRRTKAPRWTNAMYYRGEIIIPLPNTGPIDHENIFRSVRHEFVHAIIHGLSGGKCPGWLDEGLAQWAEGSVNPALYPALERWVKDNGPVPLRLLGGGFTKLPKEMVPAAYAQSLLITTALIERHGFKHLGSYLSSLRKGGESESGLKRFFRMDAEKLLKLVGELSY